MNSLTTSQEAAASSSGQVLVVAGAGAGKTRTLVQRCVDRLLASNDPVSPENMLLVTFTNAAASEMRQRIRSELIKSLSATPENSRVAEVSALLDSARISTLHVFCLNLVRENFQCLDLDPRMVTLESGQRVALMDSILDEIIPSEYDGRTDVAGLIREWAGGDDGLIRHLVVEIHEYSRSLRGAVQWIEAQEKMFDATEPREWEHWLLAETGRLGRLWIERAGKWPDFPALGQILEFLRALVDAPSRVEVNRAVVALEPLLDELPIQVKSGQKDILEAAAFLASLASADGSDPLQEDWDLVRGHMRALLGLVRRFASKFAQTKRDMGLIDFADMEQFALRLLWSEDLASLTPLGQRWRERIELLCVDEYQDTTDVQDAIIQALGREGEAANRFLVGDVKQSIYRFRLADPGIFRRYQGAWAGGRGGSVHYLSENFRSHESILNFVNAFCRRVMMESIGGVDYQPEVELQMGRPEERPWHRTGSGIEPRVEMLLAVPMTGRAAGADEGDEEVNEGLAGDEAEARRIGRRLLELHASEMLIHRDDGESRVGWNDMVILLRSPAERSQAYARAFAALGIPLEATRIKFLESTEVLDLESLLQVFDNPCQDLPLLAVMRSPFGGFNSCELAQIRLAQVDGPYWQALVKMAESGVETPLRARTAAFLAWHRRWREAIHRQPLSQCLELVLEESFYREWIASGGHVAERQANVREFVRLTREFDQFQREGLFRFLEFFRSQREAGTEFTPGFSSDGKAVRLLSIHQSKGLEFPIVVLAGLGKKFNLKELDGEILLDHEMGICPYIHQSNNDRHYPSPARWMARRRERRELLGEELRLLYVAMTRAREWLVLSGAAPSTNTAGRWAENVESAPTETWIESATSALDWFGCWLVLENGKAEIERSGVSSMLRWEVVSTLSPREETDAASAVVQAEPVEWDYNLIQDLEKRLAWVNPRRAAEFEPAKTSVTATKRREFDADADTVAFLKAMDDEQQRPRSTGMTGAEVGIAHHLFIQRGRFDRLQDPAGCRLEAAYLVERNLLTTQQAAVLDFEAIAAFWSSELGHQFLASSEGVHRELEFTARFSSTELRELGLAASESELESEWILVQGAVDLVLIRENEIWLVDFKTDQIRANLDSKIRFHRPQLLVYARALAKAHHRPVTGAWLHFLAARQSVAVL